VNSKQSFPEQDKDIYEALMKVLRKWRTPPGEKKEAWTAIEKPAEEDLDETMIISSRGIKKSAPLITPATQKDELPETVIISPAGKKSEGIIKLALSNNRETVDLEETTATNKRDMFNRKRGNEKQPAEPDFLTETVILQPRKKKEPGNDGK